MEIITSGNEIVDRMGTINISGNVIPMVWYKTITKQNGKPYLLAITLLSDIVYWYRPSEIRDELSGQMLGWKKRFHGDMLQKTYQQYADMFGESRKTVKTAMDCLEQIGVIQRHFKNVTYGNGITSYNVMFIELNIEKLKEVTFPQEKTAESPKIETEVAADRDNKTEALPYDEKNTTLMTNLTPPPTDLGTRSYQEKNEVVPFLERGYDKLGTILMTNLVPPLAKKVGTNTEIITENTKENTTKNMTKTIAENTKKNKIDYDIYPIYQETSAISSKKASNKKIDTMDTIEVYRQLIKQNIGYDSLITESGYQTGLLEEILELLVETVSVERKRIRIGGTELPYQLVKGKFCKLNREHIQYVLDCMQKNTTKIGNIRSYLLTALYNAPNTMNNYYQSEVNHDMYGYS